MWQGGWGDDRFERRWDLDPGSGGGLPGGEEPGGGEEGGAPLPPEEGAPPAPGSEEGPPASEGGEPLPPEPWDPPPSEGGGPPEPEGEPGNEPEGTTPIGRPGGDEDEEPGGSGAEEVRIYEWRTAQDARVCPICGPLDGGRWEGGDGPFPPAHIGCRCARVLVTIETRTVRRAPLGNGGAKRRW